MSWPLAIATGANALANFIGPGNQQGWGRDQIWNMHIAQLQERTRWNRQSQRNWQESFYNPVLRRTQDAQRAGISPLAALGLSGSALPSFQMPSGVPGPGPSGSSPAARALGTVASGIQDWYMHKERKEERRKDRESRAAVDKARAEAEGARAQALLAQAEVSKRRLETMGASQVANTLAGRYSVAAALGAEGASVDPSRAEPIPGFVDVVGPHGTRRRNLNPKRGDETAQIYDAVAPLVETVAPGSLDPYVSRVRRFKDLKTGVPSILQPAFWRRMYRKTTPRGRPLAPWRTRHFRRPDWNKSMTYRRAR